MDIAMRSFPQVLILDVSGDLDMYNAHRLREAAARIIRTERRAVIVNLKAVPYIDSSGVAALLAINAQMAGRARPFRIINARGPVLRVMELTQLTGFLPLSPSELDAIESVQESQPPAASRSA